MMKALPVRYNANIKGRITTTAEKIIITIQSPFLGQLVKEVSN